VTTLTFSQSDRHLLTTAQGWIDLLNRIDRHTTTEKEAVTDRHTGSIDILKEHRIDKLLAINLSTEPAGTIDIVLIPIGKRPIDILLLQRYATRESEIDYY
jgi:hypothetical protein